MLPFSIEELVHTYIHDIYRFVFRMVQDEALAADITQDVCITCWQKSGTYNKEKASVKTWIFTIAYRKTVDHIRKGNTKKKYELLEKDFAGEETIDDIFEDVAPLGEELFAQQELSSLLSEALETLSPIERSIVTLYHESNITFAEIAEIEGSTLNTTKSRYRRALVKLQAYLAPKLT